MPGLNSTQMTATNPELKNTIPDVSMYAIIEFLGFGNILVIVAQILGQHMMLCVFGSFGIRPSILEKTYPRLPGVLRLKLKSCTTLGTLQLGDWGSLASEVKQEVFASQTLCPEPKNPKPQMHHLISKHAS